MKKQCKWVSVVLCTIMIMQILGISSQDLPVFNARAYAAEQPAEIKINFQPYGASVPDGYLPDYGEVYGNRNGSKYGWNKDHADMAVVTDSESDSRLGTAIEFHNNGVWEMELANGSYDVTVGVGESVYGSVYSKASLEVEGIKFWENMKLDPGEFQQKTETVQVKDGKLTIDQGMDDSHTKINFVHITPVEVTPILAKGDIKLQMYNANRNPKSNTVYPHFKLLNTGSVPVDLSKIKIRYYYMYGGDKPQNFWCDWSSAGTSNVTGTFIKNPEPKVGADTYLEIGFKEGTGNLEAGGSVEIQTRFARPDWENYLQTDDYSFNETDKGYADWTKATVYMGGQLIWGDEPDTPMARIISAKAQMYNSNRSNSTATIYPMLKLYNTGTLPFNLEDAVIRYYYTTDGDKPQNFWCDWAGVGSTNITGSVTGNFVKIPFTAPGVDSYLEIGFKPGAGSLMAGDGIEIQTRFAKNNWENYTQSNDYSFNSSASGYVDWTKVAVYVKGKLVWGDGLLFGVPSNLDAQATENTVTVTWDPVEGATGYDIEVDGAVMHNGLNTSYVNTGLEPGREHSYRVRATNPLMNGDWTEPLKKWTVPGVPQNIRMTSTGNSITITWDPVVGATGYDVEVQGMPVDNGASTSYTHTGLNPNLQQAYRIRAKNSSGAGRWSPVIMKTTLPAVPINLNTAATDTEIRLTWDAVAGATGYDVEVDNSDVVSVTDAVYLHEGLKPISQHTYRVRSKNAEGVSDWSESITATTQLSVPKNFNARVTI